MYRLENGQQFNAKACVPDTKKDVFYTVEGKLDANFPRVGHTEENGDYTRNHYIASFKLSGREEFRSGLNLVLSRECGPQYSSMDALSLSLYDKLYDETDYKISIEVPLKIKYEQENLVHYLNVYFDEMLYDQVLRPINRQLEGLMTKL